MALLSNIVVMKEKLSELKESKKMTDVTVIVGPEKVRFVTHKFLLSIFSDVFYNMFYGEMAENSQQIELPEDTAESFNHFLSWIYTSTFNIKSVESAISCLYFADKYLVTRMKQMLITYLQKSISLESVLKIYEAASILQQNDLKSNCWKYMIDNSWKIIRQDDIKYVSFETMLSIVREDELILKSEVDMYDAVIKWGKHQFSGHSSEYLRKKLNRLLLQIRFLTMTPTQFVGSPCEDGILTESVQLGILKEISGRKIYGIDVESLWRKPRKSKRIP